MIAKITTEQTLIVVSILMTLTVAARLYVNDIHRNYPAFWSFLLFSIVRMLVLIPGLLSAYTFAVLWMVSEGVAWVFYVLVLMELYTLVLSRYPGIQSLSRWIFHGSVGVSLVIAAFTLYPDLGGGRPPDVLMLFMIAERGILAGLAVLTLLIIGFLTWFPVPLPRNVVLHSILFAFYFFSKAAALLVRNVMGHRASERWTTIAIMGVGWVCMLLWALLMTREGEGVEARVGHRWNEDEEDRLLDQLREINSSLSRSVR